MNQSTLRIGFEKRAGAGAIAGTGRGA